MPSAWTTTLPQGSTKIRMAPAVLQDRWTNIQQGEVPSTKWQLARRAGNPGAIPSVGLIFTKDGGAGWSEFYYKDDQGSAKTTQITKDGGIGAPAQAVYGSTYITLQSDLVTTFTNTQDGFVSAAGRVSSTGSLDANYLCNAGTTIRISTGLYRVVYATPLKTATGYSIQITPRDLANTSDAITYNVTVQNANHFEVKFRKFEGPSDNRTFGSYDTGFMFTVFMSRI